MWLSRKAVVRLAYATVLLVALVAVIATLAISEPIDSQTGTARYGRPLWFAESDMTSHTPSPAHVRWRFNPWENPTTVRGAGFIASYAAFAAPLCGIVFLLSRVTPRRRSSRQLTRRD